MGQDGSRKRNSREDLIKLVFHSGRIRLIALSCAFCLATALPAAPPQRSAVAPTPAQPDPRPALWLLADADTRIYLFGTFHILPPGFRWRSPAVDAAIREADELVLEVSDGETLASDPAIQQLILLGKTAPLAWRVSPDRRETLQDMVDASGLPADTLDSMQTWAAALTIAVVAMIRSYGGDAPLTLEDVPGVEHVLRQEFSRARRPVSGVETARQQVGYLAGESFADQRQMLEQMVDAYGSGETIDDIDESDWVQGNVEALAMERADMPGTLYDALIVRRNAAWTDWLQRRLERPGTVFFAVGAGHLTGADSVQTMLATRGLTARRIDR